MKSTKWILLIASLVASTSLNKTPNKIPFFIPTERPIIIFTRPAYCKQYPNCVHFYRCENMWVDMAKHTVTLKTITPCVLASCFYIYKCIISVSISQWHLLWSSPNHKSDHRCKKATSNRGESERKDNHIEGKRIRKSETMVKLMLLMMIRWWWWWWWWCVSVRQPSCVILSEWQLAAQRGFMPFASQIHGSLPWVPEERR